MLPTLCQVKQKTKKPHAVQGNGANNRTEESMSQELSIFNYSGMQVRTIEKNGEPYFVAKDVADALGYANSRDAIKTHCKCADTVAIHDGTSGNPNVTVIPERDVYRLVMRSKLESAERFEEWVVSEVLPSIRKTGMYSMRPEIQIANALVLATKMLEDSQKLIEHMQPKAEFYDAVTGSGDAVDIGTVAKVLNCGIGRTRLFSLLRDEKILMVNNQPYQEYIDRGYFRVIETSFQKPDGSTHINYKTVVYQKGIDFIRRRIQDMREAA